MVFRDPRVQKLTYFRKRFVQKVSKKLIRKRMRAERKICPKFVPKLTKKRSKKRPKIDSQKSRKNVKKRSGKVTPILTFPGRVARALSGFYPGKKQNKLQTGKMEGKVHPK